MSTTTTTAITDAIPSTIPKLDPSGVNWQTFMLRFMDAIQGKGYWGHFDGSESRPGPTGPLEKVEVSDTDGTTTATRPSTTEDDKKAMEKWDRDEATARSLLTQRVPDSTLIMISVYPSVYDQWRWIVKEFTEKSKFTQTSMKTVFLNSKCPDKSDVRKFLDSLRVKKEELITYGVHVSDEDFLSTIIKSLPQYLSHFASNLLANARLWSETGTIDPHRFIAMVSEEYDVLSILRSTKQGGKGSGGGGGLDEALAVEDGGRGRNGKRGKGKRKPKDMSNITCWCCKKKGHYASNCPENPDRVQKNEKESKPNKGVANAVEDDDSDDINLFAAVEEGEIKGSFGSDSEVGEMTREEWVEAMDEELWALWEERIWEGYENVDREIDDEDDEIPELEEIPVSDDEEDEDMVTYCYDSRPITPTINAVTTTPANIDVQITLYDSGSTRHLSPYRDNFINFQTIPPFSLRAANKGSFDATGIGEMVVNVPNGTDTSMIHLSNVLYSPEVGYNLISIGQLDEMGYTCTFRKGRCIIESPEGERVGEILRNTRGVYRVEEVMSTEDEEEWVGAVEDEVTLEQFHRRMGHIAPDTARKLISKGLVTGVKLAGSNSTTPFFCEACVFAKSTAVPIPKVREGERAKEFGGEVHSDLWGPAPVETLRGH
ncbi:hypothetical protein CVT24_001860 [Panaeolus cyanescens]|uniref:CCHC-type domain-containing protein n=1 Tax=Panaeolus cyanescens TaxID=181874 RepID=A0A409YEL8_9AGAR|nr:hypothetical protein CVT24_001860 [Panaeolus cyanescens]